MDRRAGWLGFVFDPAQTLVISATPPLSPTPVYPPIAVDRGGPVPAARGTLHKVGGWGAVQHRCVAGVDVHANCLVVHEL